MVQDFFHQSTGGFFWVWGYVPEVCLDFVRCLEKKAVNLGSTSFTAVKIDGWEATFLLGQKAYFHGHVMLVFMSCWFWGKKTICSFVPKFQNIAHNLAVLICSPP